LPDSCRRLLTRAGFFIPSVDGGLSLFELFSPSRRSNSAIRACNAAISAAWRSSCASSNAISSAFESCLSAALSMPPMN
jgi:hypothetical protein